MRVPPGTLRRDPIASLLARRCGEGRFPGAVWWVGEPGSSRHGAVGNRAVEPRVEPASEATPYDLASLTKVLCTAPLLCLMEQDGALALEQPAREALPELAGSTFHDVSLLDLATHAAGLPAWAPCYLAASTLDATVERIARMDRGPGGVYSDLGYILLGAAIERIAGERLDRLFDHRVAAVLGLERTGFATDDRRFADAAPTERGNAFERRMAGPAGAGYAWRTETIRGAVHDANAHRLGGVAGHAGLFGVSAEVARVGHALIGAIPGPWDPPARRRLSVVEPGRFRPVGFVPASAARAARDVLPDRAIGHTGFTGTSIWLEPDRATVHLLLTNRVHPRVPEEGFDEVRREFHRAAIGAPHDGPLQ